MKKFISLSIGFVVKRVVLPAIVFLVVLTALRLSDRQEPAVSTVLDQLPTVVESAQDYDSTRLNAPSRVGEVELTYMDFDRVKEDLAGYTRAELIERFNPEPVKPERFVEAITSIHPLDSAEYRYNTTWKGFAESLDLSDAERRQLREILISHDAHNAELKNMFWTGEISMEEHASFRRTYEQLAESLEVVLSGEQIARFWEETGRQSAANRQGLAELEAQRVANGEVGILAASGNNDTASVLAHIDSGANVNEITSDGSHTPLLDAVLRGNMEMTRILLEAGADPNMASADGFEVTPLRMATRQGDAEIVRALAAAGADLDFVAQRGLSPLRTASLHGQTDTVAVLLELGADATGEEGAWALADAIDFGDHEMERMLLEAGAPADDILVVTAREKKEIGRRLGVVFD